MIAARAEQHVRAALIAAEDEEAAPAERAEMLMEMAMGLQQRPQSPDELAAAIRLYDTALRLCPAQDRLLRARIAARRGTALQALPESGTESLEAACAAYEAAIPDLAALGRPEELAEAEMNFGLVLQHLAGIGHARITDAIAAYQRALRTFDRTHHPVEFAILQNNLATAFLSMSAAEGGAMRQAMAVQAFAAALEVVTMIDHPSEYAMLQNNLGNALQHAASSHPVENRLRALDAYDEALRVRRADNMPVEYANTIANKAGCLWSLAEIALEPKDALPAARAYYQEAQAIFAAHGDQEKAAIIAQALVQLDRERTAVSPL